MTFEEAFENAIKEEMAKNTQQILDQLQETKCKIMQNSIAEAQGKPIPYPELTEEARRTKAEEDRNTWMYGYGVCFKDDREWQALQEGKLIL